MPTQKPKVSYGLCLHLMPVENFKVAAFDHSRRTSWTQPPKFSIQREDTSYNNAVYSKSRALLIIMYSAEGVRVKSISIFWHFFHTGRSFGFQILHPEISENTLNKHCKNCEFCPVSLSIVRLQRLSWIQVLHCQNCNQCLKFTASFISGVL